MNWLADLIKTITDFIPRPVLIAPDEGGVRVTPKLFGGTWVRDLKPGWYLLFPKWQGCEKIRIKTQVKDLRPQSTWTKDGHEIIASGAIRYKIVDAVAACLNVYDYDQNIQATALGIICRYISTRTLEELKSDYFHIQGEILRGLRESSRGWGIKVEDVLLTDIGRGRNIRLLLNEPFIIGEKCLSE